MGPYEDSEEITLIGISVGQWEMNLGMWFGAIF